MTDALAATIFSACLPNRSIEGVTAVGVTFPSTPELTPDNTGGGKEGLLAPGNSGAEEAADEGHVDGPGSSGTIEDSGNTGQREAEGAEASFPGVCGASEAIPWITGRGMLKACYKGRTRPFHDGLGLCSIGRLKAEARPVGRVSAIFDEVKGIFWGELENWLKSLGRAGELKVMATVLCGRLGGSPFGDLPGRIRAKWIERLVDHGLAASRRVGDRETVIELRLLAALANVVGDLDYGYLDEMASSGARLGTDGEVPRVPHVYEAKGKWNLPEGRPGHWQEEQMQANYRSADDHMDKVKAQIAKEMDQGWIIEMPLEKARSRYGKSLKIAALAAVPKDTEWEQIRVVHDATNGVEVNHQIRLCNQIRFPLFDDLEAAMHQFLTEADARRLAMAYDYKGAHRLVPIHEDDWGKQAFRLDDPEVVYLNCVGTFGVASAAFWWSRLAATLQRTMWAFLPPGDPLYILLFADDGLCLASGPRYRKNLLAVLLFLTVLGAPLSWAKTRGGQQVEWLGYQLDLRMGLMGVSERKVDWLETWVNQTLLDGSVLGREMKAALGRMGFLAGPLKHARPFLALLYRWSSKIGAGAFLEMPLSVRLTMSFFLEAVKRAPLRAPRGIPKVGGEIFRVDAKAEGSTVVIGGWESYSGPIPARARWFSTRLDRKNSPWVFVKGEPFKVIASLELLAITVAIMVFLPNAEWREAAGRLTLTAFTDNQANSYVLDKYMSTAFPLSIVLMELALHLQRAQVDLDLQWIPRDQNTEADALTNENFEGFDEARRIPVKMEELEFIILHKLMRVAEEIDSEIVLKRASKEKSAHRDATKKMRLTQPW
jgi:hypothetical protein